MDARHHKILSALKKGDIKAANDAYELIKVHEKLTEGYTHIRRPRIEIALLKIYLGQIKEAKSIVTSAIEANQHSNPQEKASLLLLLMQIEKYDGNYQAVHLHLAELYRNHISKISYSTVENQSSLFLYLMMKGISFFDEILHVVLFKPNKDVPEKYLLQLSSANHYINQAREIHHIHFENQMRPEYPLLLAYYGLIQTLYVENEKKPSMIAFFDHDQIPHQSPNHSLDIRIAMILILKSLFFLYMEEYTSSIDSLKQARNILDSLLSFQGENYIHPTRGYIHVIKARIHLNLGFSMAAEFEMGQAFPHLQSISNDSQHWILRIAEQIDTELEHCVKPGYSDSPLLFHHQNDSKKNTDTACLTLRTLTPS